MYVVKKLCERWSKIFTPFSVALTLSGGIGGTKVRTIKYSAVYTFSSDTSVVISMPEKRGGVIIYPVADVFCALHLLGMFALDFFVRWRVPCANYYLHYSF